MEPHEHLAQSLKQVEGLFRDARTVSPSLGEFAMQENMQLRADCMTMALRLYGENEDTFSPETAECMDRWRPKVEAILRAEPA